MRSLATALLAGLLAMVACGPPPAPVAAAGPSRPPVAVAIVVDQFAAWIADERLPLLPASGGFARLRREGTWYRKMRFAHAITDTGPGHAALYTGAPPRRSGVWGNEWVDDDGSKRSIFTDERTTVVAPVAVDRPSVSSLPVKLPTIADRLREARPDSVIISVSIKDRAAILGGGRRPTVALWFDRDLNSFATSSAYAAAFPSWAVPIAGHDALVARQRQPWRPLDPAWLERNAKVPDDGPGEGDLAGYGTRFPHDLAAPGLVESKQIGRAFRSNPLADEVTLDLAAAALERLGRPDATTFVALSLSGNDYVGHLFGVASRESWDNLLRLDRALGRFFAVLDARYGAAGWSLALTGDHGVEHPFAHRLVHKEMSAQLDAAAVRDFGPGKWVAGVADPYVFLTSAARALPPEKLEALVALVRKEAAALPGVAGAYDARATAEDCPPEEDDSVPALLCRSLPPTREPRIYVLVADDAGYDSDLIVGSGDNHGSPRLEDRTVPLIVRAPGRVAAGRVVEAPVSYQLFGATLATLLGL